MFPANPVRDLWIDVSHFAGGTNGTAVDLSNFAGPVSAIVIAGPSLASSRTVTFQGTGEGATVGTPDTGSWAALNQGGFCDDESALSVVCDPASDQFTDDSQIIKRVTLQCPVHFVRAVLSGADANIPHVIFMGKAKRVHEA